MHRNGLSIRFWCYVILCICINYECDAQSCGLSTEKMVRRIIGGVPAKVAAWPWMVSLSRMPSGYYPAHFCGGSILTPDFIITAAHCIYGGGKRDLVVVGGVIDLMNTEQWIIQSLEDATYYIHPNYKDDTTVNDIALIRLAKPLDLTKTSMKPICLPTNTSPQLSDNTALMIIGWGHTQEGARETSPILRQASVKVVGQKSRSCSYHLTHSDGQFCAGLPYGEADTCQGDSGGPVMSFSNGRWYLQGITSFGSGCGRADTPGINARVSFYLPWINSILNQPKPKKRFAHAWQQIMANRLLRDEFS